MVFNVQRNHKAYQGLGEGVGGGGGGGKGVWRGGKRGNIYLSLHCHQRNAISHNLTLVDLLVKSLNGPWSSTCRYREIFNARRRVASDLYCGFHEVCNTIHVAADPDQEGAGGEKIPVQTEPK